MRHASDSQFLINKATFPYTQVRSHAAYTRAKAPQQTPAHARPANTPRHFLAAAMQSQARTHEAGVSMLERPTTY